MPLQDSTIHNIASMTNKAIANAFDQLARLMELHGENPFKIRSYQSAYRQLRNFTEPLSSLTDDQLKALKGVGSAIATKIRELLETGKMQTLERYRAITPEGVQEMLTIKGFGPKKVKSIWQELGIESLGELLYACNENRLVELKGFGLKTQEQLRRQLAYALNSRGKFHYATAEEPAREVLRQIQSMLESGERAELSGPIRRGEDTVEVIDMLLGTNRSPLHILGKTGLGFISSDEDEAHLKAIHDSGVPISVRVCDPSGFGSRLFEMTGSDAFFDALKKVSSAGAKLITSPEEEEVFRGFSQPYLPACLRSDGRWVGKEPPRLVSENDIRGVIHAHSTWSDGLNSLEEMAKETRDLGYEYLVITDHSQAAFYANGLKPERLRAQWEEIDRLNSQMAPFRIFKGIESDILGDGSLDYKDEVLQGLDVVIASVHSHLRMEKEKATERILKAIAHPSTTILGHPTGRLLLVREGYPLDHQRIIDTCAEHGVCIELNAHPWRLDLDWTWIPYAVERGVRISINPEAHSVAGLRDIHFGVVAARKGGLESNNCLNTLGLDDFQAFLGRQERSIG